MADWWQNEEIPSDSDGEGNLIPWWEEGHGRWQENASSDSDSSGGD